MNNAQATMSGARKTGDMGWARGKDAIMPTMLPLSHVRQQMFRILQQSFFSRAARKERLRKRRACLREPRESKLA
ncbi:hypothetical protein [Burkholderia cepacia]|uniref:hypothetical protein n=1 Tax=Burkholderia cepacia TaxID=292 RepID=UPI002AB67EB2|nr:hypothetical protein [Burkholderia cepacia]